jgi:hypothetical protein
MVGEAWPPRTSEGETNGGRGEAPARCVAAQIQCFLPVWVVGLLQRRCSGGPCMAVAFFVWWRLHPLCSFSVGSRQLFRPLHLCGCKSRSCRSALPSLLAWFIECG